MQGVGDLREPAVQETAEDLGRHELRQPVEQVPFEWLAFRVTQRTQDVPALLAGANKEPQALSIGGERIVVTVMHQEGIGYRAYQRDVVFQPAVDLGDDIHGNSAALEQGLDLLCSISAIAVNFTDGELPDKVDRSTVGMGFQLADFLCWRYCFTWRMAHEKWIAMLRHYAQSQELFPMRDEWCYARNLECRARETSYIF